MKHLSINIPTYNRCTFLRKNLSIIIDQLRESQLQEEVEINISDNASNDGTENEVHEFIEKNHDISINYLKQEKNYGPDVNFIEAMKMASGEYSILFGDDDFFEPGSIEAIFDLLEINKDITFFLSNRIEVDSNDSFYSKTPFLRSDISNEKFDFSIINDGRAFFSLVRDHGGILSFISSVVYRTSIIKEVGAYNEKCTGSCYSFLYYWWSSLASGKKIMYINEYFVRATTIGSTNANYGKGLKRLLVDTEGLSTIANEVFVKERLKYKKDFLAACRRPIAYGRIASSYFPSNKKERARLLRSMSSCDYSKSEMDFISYIFNLRNGIKICLKNILPNVL